MQYQITTIISFIDIALFYYLIKFCIRIINFSIFSRNDGF